jgi:peptide/nickel transport system substrate-binding protein
MRRIKGAALVGGVSAVALLLAGCGSTASTSSSTDAASKPVMGGDLVVGRPFDAISMNKTLANDSPSLWITQQIMEPLFTSTDDGKSVKPLLAAGYEVSADKLTYTINLRKGVKFSDGTPMTAKDVKFSIDEDTKTASTGWGYINAAIDQVNVVDDNTVEIKLKYVWAPILADLALFSNAIIPENYQGKTAEEFYTAPVGTGPFKWDTWQKGQSLKVTKNTNYWQAGKPYLNSVTWTVVPDANTRKLQLQGGQIDINQQPDWSSFDSLKNTPGLKTYAFPSTQVDYMSFNQKVKPFEDVHVRRAISYAIDRQALVKAVLFGNGSPANSSLTPGVPFYDKTVAGYTLDLNAAKAELAKSSVPTGFTTTLLIKSGDANMGATSQILQSELAQIGIKVNIRQLDPTSNRKARQASDYEMAFGTWTMDIPDPDEWMSYALDASNSGTLAKTMGYTNPEIMALNKQAQAESDQTKRAALYSQLQKMQNDDASLVTLYYSPYAYASTDKVQAFNVTPLGNSNFLDVYKTK